VDPMVSAENVNMPATSQSPNKLKTLVSLIFELRMNIWCSFLIRLWFIQAEERDIAYLRSAFERLRASEHALASYLVSNGKPFPRKIDIKVHLLIGLVTEITPPKRLIRNGCITSKIPAMNNVTPTKGRIENVRL
jgi:hypothetical protein